MNPLAFAALLVLDLSATATPEQLLQRVFAADVIQTQWFSPSLLQRTSLNDLDRSVRGTRHGLGALVGVEADPSAGKWRVRFEAGHIPVSALFEDDRIRRLSVSSPVRQKIDPVHQAVVNRLMIAGGVETRWFDDGFKGPFRIADWIDHRDRLAARFGLYLRLALRAGQYHLEFAEGLLPITLMTSPSGRLQYFNYDTASFVPGTRRLAAVLSRITASYDQLSAIVLHNGQVLAAHQQSKPLPAGQAIRLAVMASLRDRLERGEAHWNEQIGPVLRAGDPAYLPQSMQGQETRSLRELAVRMMSQRDLTATRALMDFLGGEALTQRVPGYPANRPLLSAPQVRLDALNWELSALDLCGLMDRTWTLSFMTIADSGMTAAEHWQYVAWVGEVESDYANATFGLRSVSGQRYCVSMMVHAADSEPPVEAAQFRRNVAQLVAALGELAQTRAP